MKDGYRPEVWEWARAEILKTFNDMKDCRTGRITINMNMVHQQIEVVEERHRKFSDERDDAELKY